MLVLSRKKNERIMVGDDVEVMIVEVRGDRVKLGIVAPDGVEIDREEVRIAKMAERRGDDAKH